MEDSFLEIAVAALDIVEFARCPYIHKIYSHIMLEGFCADSYSGFYHVHVSHLATLALFFTLMVNAALLYPHYKGKTMKHLCPCLHNNECRKGRGCGGQVLVDEVHMIEAVMLERRNPDSDSDGSDQDEDEEAAAGRRDGARAVALVATVDPDTLVTAQDQEEILISDQPSDLLDLRRVVPLNTMDPKALDNIIEMTTTTAAGARTESFDVISSSIDCPTPRSIFSFVGRRHVRKVVPAEREQTP